MALVYRAIWRENPGDAIARGHREFARWLYSKHQVDLPAEGSVAKVGDLAVEVVVSRSVAEGVSALRCALHEDSGEQRWTTTLTVLESADQRPAYWVDLEMVATDAFGAPQAEPPRLVLDLLNAGRDPRSGYVPLATTHHVWAKDDAALAAELIADPGRDIPVIVFTVGEDGPEEASERARVTARKLAGVASVALLDPLGVDDFSEAIGPELGVGEGAARVYLPGAGHDGMPDRHFVVPPTVTTRDRFITGRIVADRLATSIAARRAPREYEVVRRSLSSGPARKSAEELEELWDDAVREAERLRSAAESAEDQQVLAVLELEESERENERLRRSIAYMARQLQGDAALPEGLSGADLPDTADDPSRAVELARQHLGLVAIPPAASATTAELDAALQARVWGQKTWQALRALQLYALACTRFAGFWDWCERSGHPYAWPATPKKLAMSDSDTAVDEYSGDRTFAIDPRVRGERTQLMEAHIKVSAGGGQLTPRIYFYDDTKGVTGKVHVGFVGPHKYLRNAGSN